MDIPRLTVTNYGSKTDPEGAYVDYIEHARLVAKLEAERDRLRGLLRELYSWAKNWGAAFMEDDEWPEVGERIVDALEESDG